MPQEPQPPYARPPGEQRTDGPNSPQSEPRSFAEAKARTDRLRDAAGERIRDEAARRKHGVASELKSFSSALSDTSARTEGESHRASRLLGEAADFIQDAADKLENETPDQLLDDVRNFARNRPGVFLTGCAALGFLAARVAQASPQKAGNSDGYA